MVNKKPKRSEDNKETNQISFLVRRRAETGKTKKEQRRVDARDKHYRKGIKQKQKEGPKEN